MTTWKDIKLATLQKMFSSNGTTIQADSSTAEYVNSMPQAANEALQLLSTAGKFIIKSKEIFIKPYSNLLGDTVGFKTYELSSISDVLNFQAAGCHSLYFRVSGNVTITISYHYKEVVDEEVVEQTYEEVIELNAKEYTKVKRILENPDNDVVTLTITSPYPANIQNVCFYAEKFEPEYDEEENPVYDSVPDYERFIKFKMNELVEDFYQLYELYIEKEAKPYYLQISSYYQEADKTLVLQRSEPGLYTVYYKAYPTQITLDTPDEYEFPLDPEVVALIPLYMASQLYKDDDLSTSTIYRNEFSAAFDLLKQNANAPHKEEFESESGW